MRNFQFSNIRKSGTLPAKTRTVKDSPLAVQMKKLSKVGHSFLIEKEQLTDSAPTIYATARRLGVKVKLRSEEGGIGVYLAQAADQDKSIRKAA